MSLCVEIHTRERERESEKEKLHIWSSLLLEINVPGENLLSYDLRPSVTARTWEPLSSLAEILFLAQCKMNIFSNFRDQLPTKLANATSLSLYRNVSNNWLRPHM